MLISMVLFLHGFLHSDRSYVHLEMIVMRLHWTHFNFCCRLTGACTGVAGVE